MHYAFELGLRGLARHPRTMVMAVILLALGLAAVMTMLNLMAMLSVDPLPGLSRQLHLAWVDSRQAARSAAAEDYMSTPHFLWKLGDAEALAEAHPEVRQTVLAETILQVESGDRAQSEFGRAVLAQGPMPAMFGVPLMHGRFWTAEEEDTRARVVVLSQRTSLSLLGTGNGVGREVAIGDATFRVIGISGRWAPQPAFHFLQPGQSAWTNASSMGLFVPLRAALDGGVAPMSTRICDGDGTGGYGFDRVNLDACRWLALWAELPTPAQQAAFEDALAGFAQQRYDAGAFERPPHWRLYTVREWLDANHVVPDSVRLNLWLAIGLLALCMVNVAGLLAARFLRRSTELGVRRVLGAPRRAIVVQCLVEAGAVGAAGGLLALPLTLFGLWVIRLQDQGYTDQARFDAPLFALLLALAVGVGLLVGLLPAWRAARIAPALQVKSL